MGTIDSQADVSIEQLWCPGRQLLLEEEIARMTWDRQWTVSGCDGDHDAYILPLPLFGEKIRSQRWPVGDLVASIGTGSKGIF